ncbi:small-subunit processome [Gorgonomyces haynaldii]|nr:small-subunit processome [Gorgonomyces haynaldii]
MSSFKKAAPRRTHKERSQLSNREHLGMLEKHKDYVLRARDYHKKEKVIKKLQEKASQRNPDEFYFGMIRARTEQGKHIQERSEAFDKDTAQLLKTQDLNYVNYQSSINRNKLSRMAQGIQEFEGQRIVFDEDGNPKKQAPLPSMTEEQLKSVELQEIDEEEREKHVKELGQRLYRQEQLDLAQRELVLQKQLLKKGHKFKKGTDDRGLPVYKWAQTRSK